jgi:hypothetical protein
MINLETDMLFIRHGFEKWITSEMAGYDYMAPNLVRFISPKSKWRPYRSLRPELEDWHTFFSFKYIHGAFRKKLTLNSVNKISECGRVEGFSHFVGLDCQLWPKDLMR